MNPGPEPPLDAECRYCHEREPLGELVAPCDCAGSARYVHASPCLEEWIRRRRALAGGGEDPACEVCGTAYFRGAAAAPGGGRPSVWGFVRASVAAAWARPHSALDWCPAVLLHDLVDLQRCNRHLFCILSRIAFAGTSWFLALVSARVCLIGCQQLAGLTSAADAALDPLILPEGWRAAIERWLPAIPALLSPADPPAVPPQCGALPPVVSWADVLLPPFAWWVEPRHDGGVPFCYWLPWSVAAEACAAGAHRVLDVLCTLPGIRPMIAFVRYRDLWSFTLPDFFFAAMLIGGQLSPVDLVWPGFSQYCADALTEDARSLVDWVGNGRRGISLACYLFLATCALLYSMRWHFAAFGGLGLPVSSQPLDTLSGAGLTVHLYWAFCLVGAAAALHRLMEAAMEEYENYRASFLVGRLRLRAGLQVQAANQGGGN